MFSRYPKQHLDKQLDIQVVKNASCVSHIESGILLDHINTQDELAPEILASSIQNGTVTSLSKLFGTAILECCNAIRFHDVPRGKFYYALECLLNLKEIPKVFMTARMFRALHGYFDEESMCQKNEQSNDVDEDYECDLASYYDYQISHM